MQDATKFRIFNSNVKTVELYGCETWKQLSQQHTSSKPSSISAYNLYSASSGVILSNEELWKRTGQENVEV